MIKINQSISLHLCIYKILYYNVLNIYCYNLYIHLNYLFCDNIIYVFNS